MNIIYYDNIVCIIQCSEKEFKLIPNNLLDGVYLSCGDYELDFFG